MSKNKVHIYHRTLVNVSAKKPPKCSPTTGLWGAAAHFAIKKTKDKEDHDLLAYRL